MNFKMGCWLVLPLCSVSLLSQEQRRTIKLSEVRPYVFSLETQGVDGQVCKIEIERRHWVDGRPLDLTSTISERLL